jgi:glycosyltransferase involved in cell wall biosynthesis
MKFIILLAYYKRPQMVLNALQSIKELEYNNYDLIFIDDSGDDMFKSTFYEYMPHNILTKSIYYAIMQDEMTKLKQHGSVHGHIMNEYIKQSDAEIAIVLCDDDALVPDYLTNLSKFYTDNPTINYAYSYVYYFDPSNQNYKEGSKFPRYSHHGSTYTLNMHTTPIDPFCNLDSTQVSWRTKCNKEDNIWYPSPQTRGLDAALFTQLRNKYGLCYPTGLYGQYKGAFGDQLGNRGYDFNVNVK